MNRTEAAAGHVREGWNTGYSSRSEVTAGMRRGDAAGTVTVLPLGGADALPGTVVSSPASTSMFDDGDDVLGNFMRRRGDVSDPTDDAFDSSEPGNVFAWSAADALAVAAYDKSSRLRIEHVRLKSAMFTFHWAHALVMFITQSFLPLAYLLPLFYSRGKEWRALHTLQLHPQYLAASFFWYHFLSTTFLVVMASFGMHLLPSVNQGSIFTVALSYFLHRVVVGVKYGYLPQDTYEAWVGVRPGLPKVPHIVAVRENLGVWMQADDEHLLSELYNTSMRLGVCIRSAYFTITHDSKGGSVTLKLSLEQALMEIMKCARDASWFKMLNWASFFAALGHAAYSSGAVDMALGQLPLPASVLEVVVMIVLAFNGLQFAYLLLMFTSCCFVDYQRRHIALTQLAKAVSHKPPKDYRSTPFQEKPPRISLLIAENAHMFLNARRVLLSVGLRYRLRLQQYTSALIVVMLGVAVYLVLLSVDGVLVIDSTIIQLAMDSALTLLLLGACIIMGSMTNSLAKEHIALLDARRLEVSDAMMVAKRRNSTPAVSGDVLEVNRGEMTVLHLEDSYRTLDGVQRQLRHDNELHHITFVGLRATPGLIRAVAVGALSVASFVLRVAAS